MTTFASRIACTVLLLPLALVPAYADQSDEALAALFTQLKAADNAQEAVAIEREIWQKWYERNDEDGGNSMEAAVAAMTKGRYTVALSLLNTLVEEEPDFAEAWNRRATLYYLLGEYDNSLEDIRQTLTLEPRHFGAISGIGLIMLQLEEHEKAMHAFEQVLSISPHNSGAAKSIKDLEKKLGTSI